MSHSTSQHPRTLLLFSHGAQKHFTYTRYLPNLKENILRFKLTGREAGYYILNCPF